MATQQTSQSVNETCIDSGNPIAEPTPVALHPGVDTVMGAQDLHLFREGTHGRLYDKLGCHLYDGGARFA